jgi:hypothetical protein
MQDRALHGVVRLDRACGGRWCVIFGKAMDWQGWSWESGAPTRAKADSTAAICGEIRLSTIAATALTSRVNLSM